ncbi:MAG TPA: glycogen synthase [Firmicutes bacterium]|nr:glycogen synthase [Bacillota bacterium]
MKRVHSPETLTVSIFTNEYPPNVYGGAGVHVDYLSRALAKLMYVEVRCFGDQRLDCANLRVKGYGPWDLMVEGIEGGPARIFRPMTTDIAMVRDPVTSDIVHCHTWYTFLAGFLAKTLYGVPLVVTVHSLEPLRPWKEEQLGRAYKLSSWFEEVGVKAADRIVAVSGSMKGDILSCYHVPEDRIVVIHNGIDLEEYRRDLGQAEAVRRKYGIGERYILFVGRISRQKGIMHLLDAAPLLPGDIKIVLCASAPDTRELEDELRERIKYLGNVIWIDKMLPKEELIGLYSGASVFACPSIYEPFGIINLEAMACEVPVVASAVGGIKEVVIDGETGFLVPPGDPAELALAINRVLEDRSLARSFGQKGRRRVEDHFSWDAVAKKTREMYLDLLASLPGAPF